MAREINWGQRTIGKVPSASLPYKIVNTPFDRHFNRLSRLGAGLPPQELPDERLERIAAENRELDRLLMN